MYRGHGHNLTHNSHVYHGDIVTLRQPSTRGAQAPCAASTCAPGAPHGLGGPRRAPRARPASTSPRSGPPPPTPGSGLRHPRGPWGPPTPPSRADARSSGATGVGTGAGQHPPGLGAQLGGVVCPCVTPHAPLAGFAGVWAPQSPWRAPGLSFGLPGKTEKKNLVEPDRL